MKSYKSIYILPMMLCCLSVYSSVSDSIFIEKLLQKSISAHFRSKEEKILFFADAFQGRPYASGTLDADTEEKLVTRTDSFDCTTFVETVVALYLSSEKGCTDYDCFCTSLQNVRYRHGKINGYTSRLHYFSDWVADNERKGFLKETTLYTGHKTRVLSLNYMSCHKDSYKQLKNNAENLTEIQSVEQHWTDYEMAYVPKEYLRHGSDSIKVKNGDVIAITTNIDGLDVVHLGFACWIADKLHLMHASSLHQRVILDKVNLYHYLMKRKKHIGIRVVQLD